MTAWADKQRELRLERLRLVLQWRADGLTFTEIGDRLDVTRARARQLFIDAEHLVGSDPG